MTFVCYLRLLEGQLLVKCAGGRGRDKRRREAEVWACVGAIEDAGVVLHSVVELGGGGSFVGEVGLSICSVFVPSEVFPFFSLSPLFLLPFQIEGFVFIYYAYSVVPTYCNPMLLLSFSPPLIVCS